MGSICGIFVAAAGNQVWLVEKEIGIVCSRAEIKKKLQPGGSGFAEMEEFETSLEFWWRCYCNGAATEWTHKGAEGIAEVICNRIAEFMGTVTLHLILYPDPDVTARNNALGAISSLIRHNKPGVAALCRGTELVA
ncbi:hypothetical protein C5167_026449 [Papaver somniferum]|nr:hypothetical protein C5167_026449 [Papaver somniferum]